MSEELLVLQDKPYERQWVGTSQIRSVVALMHPTAVLVFSGTILFLALIAQRGVPPVRVLVCLVFAMGFAQAAIGLFNEVCDVDLDRHCKPWRALVAGRVNLKAAIFAAFGLGILGCVFALSVSFPSFVLVGAGIGIGFLYSGILKRSRLSWLPYALAYPLPVILVWVSLGKYEPRLLSIYPIAIPFAIAVHLCNQLRDFDQDLEFGMRGFAQHLGKQNAIRLCYVLLLLSVVPVMLFGVANGSNLLLLLAFAVLCLCLMLPVIRNADNSSPETFRALFKRLQLGGPLLLCAWLVAAGF